MVEVSSTGHYRETYNHQVSLTKICTVHQPRDENTTENQDYKTQAICSPGDHCPMYERDTEVSAGPMIASAGNASRYEGELVNSEKRIAKDRMARKSIGLGIEL
jgi:hypothetical protein